jgi:hypothetical protein
MAPISPVEFLHWWQLGGDTAEKFIKRVILDGLDEIIQAESDFLAKIPKGRETANPIIKWGEEYAYPHQVKAQKTGTSLEIFGPLFGKPITEATARNLVRVGTILQQPGGAQVKVTNADGLAASPFTVEVTDYGNTTSTDDAAAVEYEIIGEPWSDFREPDEARGLDRFFRQVGTQIFAETLELGKTRQNTNVELVADEFVHQMNALLEKLRRQLAYTIYRARPYHDGSNYVYGLDVEDPTMCGLNTWPQLVNEEDPHEGTYNDVGGEISKTAIDDLVMNMFLAGTNFNQGNWKILVHPLVHSDMSDFDISYRRMDYDQKSVGPRVDTFRSKIGKEFEILPDLYQDKSILQIVRVDKLQYGYSKNDQPSRKELPTQGRFNRWLVSFQAYGLVARNPRLNIGTLYGIVPSALA